MSEEDFLKAIKLSKEELIEWLNEQYKNEKRLKEYEEKSNASVKREVIKTEDLFGDDKVYIDETVTAEINGRIIKYKNITF